MNAVTSVLAKNQICRIRSKCAPIDWSVSGRWLTSSDALTQMITSHPNGGVSRSTSEIVIGMRITGFSSTRRCMAVSQAATKLMRSAHGAVSRYTFRLHISNRNSPRLRISLPKMVARIVMLESYAAAV